MIELFRILNETLGSYPFLFVAETISLSLKAYIFFLLIIHGFRSQAAKKPWIFLLLVLLGAMLADLAWVLFLLKKLFFETFDENIILFSCRISWAFIIIQYQSLALFIESLLDKHYQIRTLQKIFLGISTSLFFAFLYFAFFKFGIQEGRYNEFLLEKISALYVLGPLMITTLLLVLYKINQNSIPKILRKQVKTVLQFVIIPYLIADFLQLYPFSFFTSNDSTGNYAMIGISSALITYAIYYCSRKVIGLRFLNLHSHVHTSTPFNFIDDFKNILEKLGHITNTNELRHITQGFFKEAFNIPSADTNLYLRKQNSTNQFSLRQLNQIESQVESFISEHNNETCSIATLLHKIKIFIHDEIAFSNFYEENSERKKILTFLNQINADIFLPIFEKQSIIAYIIIKREARQNNLFSNIERDEMLVFASYLSNIINLVQNRNLTILIKKEKEMREELFKKHQEINQYKESIYSFLQNNKRKIGILFYKNRRFIFGNQEAKELISININQAEGHPLTKALKQIAQKVEEFKSSQRIFANDTNGNRLVLSAIPNLEQNNIIITVSYPEISDIIKKQIDHLKNPSEWDYLLYLETTKTGQLINELIPGTGDELLNYKIEFLKIALSKKALLLEIPEEDIVPTVEILHHVSLRETLHILNLESSEKNAETGIKLFGINPIFGNNTSKPLLEKLNNSGTLFIKNVHFLNLETQNYLAEFIRYGYYHIFKSDQKVSSNVRIICSTNQNLQTLILNNSFSKALFNELQQTTLRMPSLLNLSEQEFTTLADGFTQQAINTQTFQNLLELNEKDKHKLTHQRPISLKECKEKIQQILVHKSKKNKIYQETQFYPAYNVTDPALIEAARLGKKALKDSQIMVMLWNKFKNQNKIAIFLGVNRSSVNRRCKEYNLS